MFSFILLANYKFQLEFYKPKGQNFQVFISLQLYILGISKFSVFGYRVQILFDKIPNVQFSVVKSPKLYFQLVETL